jgi:alpha-1,3-rhamnosyl/mannosyltransferase
VAGDAALLVEPTDTGALVAALRRALEDEVLRAELRTKGLAQAKQFTWQRAAQHLKAIYQKLLNE